MARMRTLAEIIASLEPVELRAVSALRIEGESCRVSIALFLPGAGPAILPEHIADVDLDFLDLPEGITVSGWTRYPDIERAVMPVDVEGQIREVEESGLLGHLDVSRYEVEGRAWWIVKTHAGSDAERAAWLVSLARDKG